ncbi:MAG TPA: NAD(P)H-binding protein, partial [Nocardioidaceae bacterium]|nr:NAD(P)H-binding protein [Nocardioidaceae bacterium]
MQVLIAGGTGTSGHVLARRAAAAGHQVRVLSRRSGGSGPDGQHLVRGDLTTGAGLDEAVEGVDAVVDLSNVAASRYRPASSFFTMATEHLFAAEERAGVGHHLTLSIVGVDRFPSAYYRAKVD